MAAVSLATGITPVFAQADVGIGVSPWDNSTQSTDKKKPRPSDPYVRYLSKYFNQKDEDLQKLWSRGYGRNELIKLLLITKKSGKDLKESVRQRDKDTKLSRISEQYKIDYHQILTEAVTIRKEIDYEVARSTDSIVDKIKINSEGVIVPSTSTINSQIKYSTSTQTK
jgi:hypothetical protein